MVVMVIVIVGGGSDVCGWGYWFVGGGDIGGW